MPFPNEHACEVQNSRDFVQTSIRRIRRRSGTTGKMFSVLIGRKPNSSTTETISFRYNKDAWSESEARAHCRRNGGRKFEPATNPPSRENIWEQLDKKIGVMLAKQEKTKVRVMLAKQEKTKVRVMLAKQEKTKVRKGKRKKKDCC